MFTGLVEELGAIGAVDLRDGVARVRVTARQVTEGLAIGDSVAVDGACLTVVEHDETGFSVDVVAETLRRTSLGARRVGDRVNLERALRAGDRLGGHIVQGHVDGTGTITRSTPEGEGRRLGVGATPGLLRYVVEKGSITVDGVSLTVATRTAAGFEIALIPHTLARTTLGEAEPGRLVNLEVDLVAKYVEALVRPYTPEKDS